MDQEEKIIHSITLAGLIFDIGKFVSIFSDGANDSEKTAVDFFKSYLAPKKSILPIKDEVISLLENSENKILSILKQAQKTSISSNKVAHNSSDQLSQLNSILSKIELTKPINYKNKKHVFDVCEWSDDAIFPISLSDDRKVNVEEIRSKAKRLFNQFIKEIDSIPNIELEALIDTLVFLKEKYLVYIPSEPFAIEPDISLYDHSKSVAALAVCYEKCEDKATPFLIVSADISGIQNFIYSDTNPIENSQRGKSKQLRGKSFYLSLLTDTFSDFLLKELGLSRANLLFNGGGHFVLIVPNNSQFKIKVNTIDQDLQIWFYKNFRGAINLVIEMLEADDSLYENFPIWFTKITNQLAIAKKQKSISILEEIFGLNLDNPDFGLSTQLKKEDSENYKLLNDYEKRLYNLTSLFENIGKELPRTNYFMQVKWKSQKRYTSNEIFSIDFDKFGVSWFILESKEDAKKILSANSSDIDFARLLSINNTKFIDKSILDNMNLESSNIAFGFKLLANNAPSDKYKQVLEFEKISELDSETNENLNYPLLGILRMDIDNLGSIFSFGLERESEKDSIKTLSRIVNLSREFNNFFQSVINKSAEKWNIYITYSGGDDLFAVGSWINIAHFAIEIRNKFKEFACYNPNLTISAGISLSKPNFPIAKSAKQSGDAESRAKEKFTDKDAISVFGFEYKWDTFIEMFNYGKDLQTLVLSDDKDEKISSSYIHHLLTQTRYMINEAGEINLDAYFRQISKLKYSLARLPNKPINANSIEMLGSDNNVKQNKKIKLLSKLVNGVNQQNYIKDFIIPASYVIFKNRKLTS